MIDNYSQAKKNKFNMKATLATWNNSDQSNSKEEEENEAFKPVPRSNK